MKSCNIIAWRKVDVPVASEFVEPFWVRAPATTYTGEKERNAKTQKDTNLRY